MPGYSPAMAQESRGNPALGGRGYRLGRGGVLRRGLQVSLWFTLFCFCFVLFCFLMFIYFEKERKKHKQGRGREIGRHRI